MSEQSPPKVTLAADSAVRPLNSRPSPPGEWLFFGPQGLRAGWSVLIFAALCIILIILFGMAVQPFLHLHRGTGIPPWIGLWIELSQLIPVGVATAIMAVIERRPVLYYGFQGQARSLRLVSGFVWGFIAISVVVLILHQLGYLSLDGRVMGGVQALKYGLAWGAMFLCVGFCEEAMLRGYAQFTLTRGIGFWWGALVLCLPFGLLHTANPGESLIGIAGAGAAGLIFVLSLWYTGSLWWAVGFHAAWDWGQSYFYGTADSGLVAQGHLFSEHPVGKPLWSGGTTGPEGSIVVLPLLIVIALLMAAWWHKRGEQPFRGMAWKPRRLP